MTGNTSKPAPPSPQDNLFLFYWRAIIRPHRRAAGLVFTLMALGAVLEVVTVGLTVPLLQTLMSKDLASAPTRPLVIVTRVAESLGLRQDRDVLVLVILVAASLFFAAYSGCSVAIQHVMGIAGNRMRQATRLALFRSHMRASYAEVVDRGRAAVLHDISQMPDAVFTAIDQVGGLARGLMQAILFGSMMLYLSWWATLGIGVFALLGIRVMRRFLDHRARAYGQNLYRIHAAQAQVEIDAIDGFKVIKTQGLEGTVVGRLDALLGEELAPLRRMSLYRKAPTFIDEVAASAIVIALGAFSGMDFPALAAFLLAIRRCSPVVASVNVAMVELNGVRRNVQAISDVLDRMEPERQDGAPVGGVRELRLSDVSFCYPSRPETPALKEVSVRFELGTITAIVGPTGSGKSTLVNLLLGLMMPSSGSILVDGAPLAALSLAGWRRNVGYVSQDVFLFNASIRDNIALWNADALQADLERAARTAELHDFIAGLPEGYDTLVGDRGVALSGGQCQRLAIARAVFRHPRILVLDEATSALDNATERAVYNAIRGLRQDAIVILVAHRLSTIREADQIVVLEAGHVVESGTHNALLDRRGLYSKLFRMDAVTDSQIPLSPSSSPV